MADLPLIVTAAGRAALVNATNSGTAPVTIASVGVSSTAIAATSATASLPGEIKRIATISGDVVAADTIHLTVRDAGSDIYSVRSFALYLADGTLFAAYGQASVIIEKSALSLLLLALDVRFVDVAATSLTFGNTNFLNPPATETAPGVAQFATPAEAAGGTSLIKMLSPKRAKDALLSWLGFTPANKAGDTFTGPVGRDGAFYLDIVSGSTPILNFDPNDYILFDRASNLYHFMIAGQPRLSIGAGVVTAGGATIWHAGNDGAGSGLDAGLFGGLPPSWFSDIVARLGYTPVNKLGDTINGVLNIDNGTGGRVVLSPSGDLSLWRANSNTGLLFLGSSGSRYLYYDGASYALNGADLYVSGGKAWSAGNDGAGSGLDGDLLDGQQGSWYSDITARLGYTPANKAGQTFTGAVVVESGGARAYLAASGDILTSRAGGLTGAVYFGSGGKYLYYDGASFTLSGGPLYVDQGLAWTSANDGAGSGLDSDLLDGQQGSWYADILSRLGFTPANRGGDVFTGDISVARAGGASIAVNSFGVVVGRLVAQADGNVVLYRNNGANEVPVFAVATQAGPFAVQMPITRSGNAVWDAGNDGSGSGLDADLLDGHHATDFAGVGEFAKALSDNGYQRLPGGLIIQWGAVAIPAGSSGFVPITFPIQFPNACLNASATNGAGGTPGVGGPSGWASVGNFTAGGMTVGMAASSGVGSGPGTFAHWIAIGC